MQLVVTLCLAKSLKPLMVSTKNASIILNGSNLKVHITQNPNHSVQTQRSFHSNLIGWHTHKKLVLWDSQGNMIIYFMGTRDIFWLIWGNKGYLKTTNKKFDRKYKEEQNFLIGKMGEKAEFLIDQGNMYPT